MKKAAEDDDYAGLVPISRQCMGSPCIQHTCIMNKMIGFVGLYADGLAPSKMPPCGGALAVAAVVVAEVTVVVSMSVTVLVIVAMMIDIRPTAPS
jgi:hypothetical protein